MDLLGNIPASTFPGVLAASWWDGCITFLTGDCPEQARWRRSSNSDGGRRSGDDDGLQAKRDPAALEPEERLCEDGDGGGVHPRTLLCLWRD